jgi:hypothetical protein
MAKKKNELKRVIRLLEGIVEILRVPANATSALQAQTITQYNSRCIPIGRAVPEAHAAHQLHHVPPGGQVPEAPPELWTPPLPTPERDRT